MRKLVLLISITALVWGLTSGQETPSLRDLATERGLFVGAAIQSEYLNESDYAETVAREFNMIATEWETKMDAIHISKGVFDFNRTDRMVNFAEENGMAVRGHTLIWHRQFPTWLDPNDYDRDEAIALMRDYIYTVVGRYQGRIQYWDVVNEAITDNGTFRTTPWYRMIGEEYVDLAFQFAHEADPDAVLFYNDFAAEAMNMKSDTIYNMVAGMLERGVPIHGVGLQAHLTLGTTRTGSNAAVDEVIENMTRLGELGLEVHITELDVKFSRGSDPRRQELQAVDYQNMFEACLAVDACTTIVTWGVTDKYTWIRSDQGIEDAAPLLFDENYQPKPAYFAVVDVLQNGS